MKALKSSLLPGVYELTNKEYHSGDGLSSSHLKQLVKSAAHYQAWLAEDKEPSNEMIMGSAVHCLVLEPHLFEKEYFVCLPAEDKRCKDYRIAVEQNPGKIVLTAPQYETITSAAASLSKHLAENPDLQRLIDAEGMKEKSFYWTDPDTGIKCKVRPDNLTTWGVIADIKTTRDASFDSFQKAIVDFGYFISAAFYLDGVKLALEQSGQSELVQTPEIFCLIAVEMSAPYDVAIYYLDQSSIEIGRRLYKQALQTYKECSETGLWPGLPKKFTEIGLPNWAIYKLNRK